MKYLVFANEYFYPEIPCESVVEEKYLSKEEALKAAEEAFRPTKKNSFSRETVDIVILHPNRPIFLHFKTYDPTEKILECIEECLKMEDAK